MVNVELARHRRPNRDRKQYKASRIVYETFALQESDKAARKADF